MTTYISSSAPRARSGTSVAVADDDTGDPRRWYVLGVLVLALLVVVLDNSILNVATKTIAQPMPVGLGATHGQLQWAIDAYTLVFGGLLLPAGLLGDRIGRKTVLLLGLAWFGVCSVACALAASPGQLIAGRAAMALGGALVLPATLSTIVSVFPPAERAKAIATWTGSVGLAIAIGPITGGALLAHFWWGSVFLVNVPIVLIAVAGTIYLVPESRDSKPGRLDFTGALLSIAGLVLVIYAIIRGGELASWFGVGVLGPLLVGLTLLAALVLHEHRTDQPAFEPRYFRDRAFSAAIGVNGLVFFALTGMCFFLVFYLQSVRGYSALQTGFCLLPLAVAQILFAVRASALIKRFGARLVCTVGMTVAAAGFLGLLLIGVDTPIGVLEVDLFLQGAGLALAMTPGTLTVMTAIPAERAGSGAALNNTFRQVGGSLGVAVLGSIVSTAYSGRVAGHLESLPPQLRPTAAQSVEATLAIAQRLGPQAAGVLGPAKDSFVYAMHIASVVSSAVAIAGALVAATQLPRRRQGDR